MVGGLLGACCGYLVSIPIEFLLAPIGFLVVLIFLVLGSIVGWRWGFDVARIRVAFTLLQCQHCGYTLRGTRGDTCPECGHKFSAEQMRYRDSPLSGV